MSKNVGALALHGGTPIRSLPMPKRMLLGEQEREIVLKMLDDAIQSGDAIRYNEKYEHEYQLRFTDFMGGGYADCVNSGTNAFFSALGALNIKHGSEVIIPAITDVGGVSPVFFHSLVPVMADVDKRTYNTCAHEIEKVITKKTRAIVVTHVAGEPVEMGPIMDLANKYNLYVIEDCAQSHGAEYCGKKVGSIGDISFFSTMPGKHHCTGGQGGVVFSNNNELIIKSKMLADRGKVFQGDEFTGEYSIAGLNCNMDELSAAIGCVQIQKLPDIIKSTNNIGEYIKRELAQNSMVASVGWQPDNSKNVYWFIRIKIDFENISVDKETFVKALLAEGIPVSAEYRSTPFSQPWYRKTLEVSTYIADDRKREIIEQLSYTNVEYVLDGHINVFIRENYGDKEVNDILSAIRKVEHAYVV
jgi:dTDP-4-amino-4,6-dideoxygalactose transaminase